MATIVGTSSDDTILDASTEGVTNSSDTIFGSGGDDTIFGLGGGDFIYGQYDDDNLKGGGGADTLDGGSGVDTAYFTDSLQGVNVSLITGKGKGGVAEGDTLASIENLWGSSYNDVLTATDADVDNLFMGGEGGDTLSGGGGTDTLIGGGGNDVIKGGGGQEPLEGGNGIDTLSYLLSQGKVMVQLITGTAIDDTSYADNISGFENVTGFAFGDVLGGDDKNNVIKGGGGADHLHGLGGWDTLDGGAGDDTLYGGGQANSGDDLLNGGAGNDTLDGGVGNDTLQGGSGIDDMFGEGDNDTYYVDNAADKVDESNFEGTQDHVKASVSYQLLGAVYVEVLSTTDNAGTAAIDLTGNEFDQVITGNAGKNTLDGGGGTDMMLGASGDDIYFVNDSTDFVVENASQGGDTVRASSSYKLAVGASVEALTTTNGAGSGAMTLIGNDLGQVMVGNTGLNVLKGEGGSDQLQGMSGMDTLTGGAGNDKFLFNTALNAATNVDTITDMTVAADIIRLDDAIFTQAGALGILNADAFHIGAAAADAEDRIIYNSVTGDLTYDTNGTGAGGQTLFAHLTAGLALSNTDFAVV